MGAMFNVERILSGAEWHLTRRRRKKRFLEGEILALRLVWKC
jgi:hypothetical protein